MIVTNRDDLAERLRLMRSHGMTSLSFDRARGHATEYDVVTRGYNFRIDDIHSALVLAQMKKLAEDTRRRAQVRAWYCERLAGIRGIHVPYEASRGESSHYIFPVLMNEGGAARRNAVRQALVARGIQTSVHYPPAHRFAIYRSAGAVLPRTEDVADHEITLPLFSRMTEETVDEVARGLREALEA